MQKSGSDNRGAWSSRSPSERGRAAEGIVAEWLVLRGYQIVATNLRLGHLELDVVARLGDLVIVVEVRTRGPSSWCTAFGSLDIAKRKRLQRAARLLWRRRYRHDPSVSRLRIDAAAVVFEGEAATIHYAPGAF